MRIQPSAYKKIQRLAIITSPLVAAFSFLPIIFVSLGFLELPQPVVEQINIQRLAGGFLVISFTVFVFWQLNVLLLRYRKRLRIERNIHRYLLSFLVVLILIVLLNFFLIPYRQIEVPNPWTMPILVSFANNALILVLINLILVQEEKAELELEKAQLEISNLVAQQEQLKQQIHPHFLFNALSNLQTLITKAPEQAASYTSSLAGFLRKSLSMASSDLVPIETELEYLQDYLDLQQTRFPGAISFQSNLPEEILTNAHIPVFTLQILAENAIKHNAFSPAQPLQLQLSSSINQQLVFSNNILEKYSRETASGIGLNNLSERYSLLKLPPPSIRKGEKEFAVIVHYTI